MIGHDPALFLAHDTVFFLLADQNLLDGLKEVLLADILAVVLDGVDGRLVDHIGQVGTHGAAGGQSDLFQIDCLVHLDIFCVDLEDGDAALEIGAVDDDAAVKAAGAQQGLVQDLGAVGRADDQDTLGGLETVHLGEQLIEGLLALLVASAVAGIAAAADGVDLIDENNAGRIFIGFLEQVADTGCAYAYVQLNKVGTGQ